MNPAGVVFMWRDEDVTRIYFNGGFSQMVNETPEQIIALMGVI